MATQMAVENILREVASLMSEAKNPQMQLKTPMDSSDQLNSVNIVPHYFIIFLIAD